MFLLSINIPRTLTPWYLMVEHWFIFYQQQLFQPFKNLLLRSVPDISLPRTKNSTQNWCDLGPLFVSNIKNSTREKRGNGVHGKVSPEAKIPTKWNDFLHDSSNKEGLFAFLLDTEAKQDTPENKGIYITLGSSIISDRHSQPMADCAHEEADIRVVIHLLRSLKSWKQEYIGQDCRHWYIVILVGQYHNIQIQYGAIKLWAAVGKWSQCVQHKQLRHKLGRYKSRALPAFHAYSGCCTASALHGKGKKVIWAAWNAFPEATYAFLFIVDNPFAAINITSQHSRF